jgi:hypothetical protein
MRNEIRMLIKGGMWLVLIFLLFLVFLDIYGTSLIYIRRIDIAAPRDMWRDVPLIRWHPPGQKGVDGYIDEDSTLHILTYNQLKRNFMIYLLSGHAGDWQVRWIRGGLSYVDVGHLLYGVIWVVMVGAVVVGIGILKAKETGMLEVWRAMGLVPFGMVAGSLIVGGVIAAASLCFKPLPLILAVTYTVATGVGVFSAAFSRDIEQFAVLFRAVMLVLLIPIAYFFWPHILPLWVWELMPGFHLMMLVASPFMGTPLPLWVHAALSVTFSVLLLGVSVWRLERVV